VKPDEAWLDRCGGEAIAGGGRVRQDLWRRGWYTNVDAYVVFL
jgi:hypothetical protein